MIIHASHPKELECVEYFAGVKTVARGFQSEPDFTTNNLHVYPCTIQ